MRRIHRSPRTWALADACWIWRERNPVAASGREALLPQFGGRGKCHARFWPATLDLRILV